MPQIFKAGSYLVYFWSDEGEPREPVHVHISQKRPERNATKVWLTKAGGTIVANNNSKIPNHALNELCAIIQTRRFEIMSIVERTFRRNDVLLLNIQWRVNF